jgi:hypothetical protein
MKFLIEAALVCRFPIKWRWFPILGHLNIPHVLRSYERIMAIVQFDDRKLHIDFLSAQPAVAFFFNALASRG